MWCDFVITQSNVIEAAPDMRRDSEKEWYYGNADKERLGPYSFEEVRFNVVIDINLHWLSLFWETSTSGHNVATAAKQVTMLWTYVVKEW